MRTISRAGRCEAATWRDRLVDIGRIGVGHRLDDDRRLAATMTPPALTPSGMPAQQGRIGIRSPAGWPHRSVNSAHEVEDAAILVNGDHAAGLDAEVHLTYPRSIRKCRHKS